MVIFRIINKINTFSAVLKFQLTEEIREIRKFWNRSYLNGNEDFKIEYDEEVTG